jgi:hypothetical protein
VSIRSDRECDAFAAAAEPARPISAPGRVRRSRYGSKPAGSRQRRPRRRLELIPPVWQFETGPAQPLVGSVQECGARAGDTTPDRFVGVSNAGGLGPFKGKPAADTSRYRRLKVGDFVYNPMRVNVGSIALCRRSEEEGWVSPDYVVFRLTDEAPFSAEYLLTYLKSEVGKAEITRRSRGAVRRRLYYENLERVEVPVPSDPEAWEAVLQGLASARRHLRELPQFGAQGLSAMEQALFAPRPDEGTDPPIDTGTTSNDTLAPASVV